jgi:hypothetical protein
MANTIITGFTTFNLFLVLLTLMIPPKLQIFKKNKKTNDDSSFSQTNTQVTIAQPTESSQSTQEFSTQEPIEGQLQAPMAPPSIMVPSTQVKIDGPSMNGNDKDKGTIPTHKNPPTYAKNLMLLYKSLILLYKGDQ